MFQDGSVGTKATDAAKRRSARRREPGNRRHEPARRAALRQTPCLTDPSRTSSPAPSADALPVYRLQSGFPQRSPAGCADQHRSEGRRSSPRVTRGNFEPRPTAAAIWEKTSDDACCSTSARDRAPESTQVPQHQPADSRPSENPEATA